MTSHFRGRRIYFQGCPTWPLMGNRHIVARRRRLGRMAWPPGLGCRCACAGPCVFALPASGFALRLPASPCGFAVTSRRDEPPRRARASFGGGVDLRSRPLRRLATGLAALAGLLGSLRAARADTNGTWYRFSVFPVSRRHDRRGPGAGDPKGWPYARGRRQAKTKTVPGTVFAVSRRYDRRGPGAGDPKGWP